MWVQFFKIQHSKEITNNECNLMKTALPSLAQHPADRRKNSPAEPINKIEFESIPEKKSSFRANHNFAFQ